MRVQILGASGFLVALMATSVAAGELTQKPADHKACQTDIEHLLLNKRFTAKVTFPASQEGIDLGLDGKWNQKSATALIKQRGIGIDIDEPATVTTVKVKDDSLEIHLNGGGFGTFGDFLTSSKMQRQMRATGGKASGGSRINLKFGNAITCKELADASRMMEYLSVLVDASSLRREAAKQSVPPAWAEAADQKRVLEGMDKATVVAIMREPKDKRVDLSSEPPVEKWLYELNGTMNRVITFKEGKVTRIDDM